MTTISEHQPVFSNSQIAMNMPFFDGATLAFCQSTGAVKVSVPTAGTIWKMARRDKVLAGRLKNLPRSTEVTYRPWKLAYCQWSDKVVRPISTGLPANVPERAPSFYHEGGRVHLSFISGLPTSHGFFYKLYTCSGPDMDHLEKPQPLSHHPTYFGFVSPHHVCRGALNVVHLTEKATGKTFRLTVGLRRVASVSYLTDQPAKLLITGVVDREYNPHTVLYDLESGSVSDVSVGGNVYKASLHGSQLIFVQKEEDEFESRHLRHGNCVLSPSPVQISKGE